MIFVRTFGKSSAPTAGVGLGFFKGGPPGGHKVCAKTGNFDLGVRVDIGVGGTEKSENT